ncbi:MAG: hypothetical protein R3B09_30125 [Nannocystaceae bacterium]
MRHNPLSTPLTLALLALMACDATPTAGPRQPVRGPVAPRSGSTPLDNPCEALTPEAFDEAIAAIDDALAMAQVNLDLHPSATYASISVTGFTGARDLLADQRDFLANGGYFVPYVWYASPAGGTYEITSHPHNMPDWLHLGAYGAAISAIYEESNEAQAAMLLGNRARELATVLGSNALACYVRGYVTCGDGVVDGGSGETCDDGNTRDGDGCSMLCTIEPEVEEFTDGSGWSQVTKSALIPGATVAVEADTAAADGSALALRIPGDSNLDGSLYAGPGAHAAEAIVGEPGLYGRYEFKVRFAACDPSEELVNGIFTYFNDGTDLDGDDLDDNSEIDIEVLCGEPNYLSLTVWTDYDNATEEFRKSTRVIDMHTGALLDTALGTDHYGGLSSAGSLPAIVQTDFPDPDVYYHLGFTWTATSVTYFMVVDEVEIELWTVSGAEYVPQRPAPVRLNLWHTTAHWMSGDPADFPASDAVLRVDSVVVTPEA